MDYTAQMIARIEHELRIRSLAPIPDDGYPLADEQPGWASRQAGRLLSALRIGLAVLGRPIKPEHDRPLDPSLVD
jgi:hypothetical protein